MQLCDKIIVQKNTKPCNGFSPEQRAAGFGSGAITDPGPQSQHRASRFVSSLR